MLIQDAGEADLPGILAIYNDVMATSTAIFSDQPTTLPRI
jgi:L-amino acid N-acyltransferase YncA